MRTRPARCWTVETDPARVLLDGRDGFDPQDIPAYPAKEELRASVPAPVDPVIGCDDGAENPGMQHTSTRVLAGRVRPARHEGFPADSARRQG